MPYTVLVHIRNEESVIGEMEELPDSQAQFVTLRSPRLRDGNEVSYLLSETNTVLYPWSMVHCVEVLPTEADDQIVTFVRE